MTERKTKDWAKTSSDAFVGDTGEKGDRGERIAVGLLEKMGFLVSHHPKDKAIQCAGIDLFVSLDGTKWWPVQVKNNLHFGGDVCVDRKKLYTSQATWWLHINEICRTTSSFTLQQRCNTTYGTAHPRNCIGFLAVLLVR